MEDKLVSVIIPTYKTKGGLIKSVDSVLCQTYQNVEIIVVDDNDPDTVFRKDTEKFMAKYISEKRVKYIKHEKNRNGAVARNTGIKSSSGDFIAFLDDDDYFRPTKIEKQVKYLEDNLDKDGVYTSLAIDGLPIVNTGFEGNALIPLLTERTRMFTSTLLFRRQAILAINGFTETFKRHQDFDLLIKFFYQGYKMGFISETLTDYSSTGINRLSGLNLIELKEQYLKQFSDVIDSLEREKKGLRRKIIANNYASIFVVFIAAREYRLAFKVLLKYFTMSPLDFISYLLFFFKCQIKKRLIIRKFK